MKQFKYFLLGLLIAFGLLATAKAFALVTLPPSVKKGDLLVASTTTQQLYRLPTSTTGSVLSVVNNLPTWVATSTLGISGGSLSGGTVGFAGIWSSASALTIGTLRDNGTVSGVNATSSTSSFNIQGTGALNPFRVASSTGNALLTIEPNGTTTITSLGTGLVRSSSGSLYTDTTTYLTGNQTITLSGDVSGSGETSITTAIGNDKVTEAMLKVVDTPTDEDILTYESTTGDFEWHTPAQLSLPTYTYASSSYVNLWNLTAGTNIVITTSSVPTIAVSLTPSFTTLNVTATTTLEKATTTINGLTYYWPTSVSGTKILQNDGTGQLSWVADQTGGGGSLSGGTVGFVGVWASSTAMTTGILRDNGAVAGANATSSTVTFNIQGTGTLNPFNVASSTGNSLFQVAVNGSTTVASLGTGLVRSSSGSLYTDTATYLQSADLVNYSTFAYGSSTYVNFGYGTSTYATIANYPTYTYASTTFPSFAYASSTFQVAGSYLTSALTSLSGLTGPAVHVATTSDTNILISISTTTANTLTFIPSWTGQLSIARGGTATSTAPADNALLVGTGAEYWQTVLPSCSDTTNSKLLYNSTTRAFSCGTDQAGGAGSLSGGTVGFAGIWASSTALTIGTLRDNGTVSGVNATSSTYTFNIQGGGGVNPFNVSSSTGVSMFTITQTGNVGIGTTTPGSAFVVGNVLSVSTSTNVVTTFEVASSTGTSMFAVTGLGLVGINSSTPIATLSVKGLTGYNPFYVASSTGVSLFNIGQNGSTTLSSLGTGCVGVSSGSLYTTPCGGAGTIDGSGAPGLVTTWSDADTLTTGLFRDNGTVAGINATSSTVLFNVQGTSGSTNNIFNIASSTGISIFTATANQRIGIGSSTPVSTLVVQGTSTYPTIYPLTVASSSGASLFVVTNAGKVGIGSNTPTSLFTVDNNTTNATTTLFIESLGTKGTCVVIKDADGSGYTYVSANNGALLIGTGSCE